jgi:pleiotropic regulator 1
MLRIKLYNAEQLSDPCTGRRDLAAGKTVSVLTNHKKSVRDLAMHPEEQTFASASADNIKQWQLPAGRFLQNMSGHNAIVNALAVNHDDVLVSGGMYQVCVCVCVCVCNFLSCLLACLLACSGDNGSLHFWDWRTGYNFQQTQTVVQPGSLESEAGIFKLVFDMTGTRLISCEADKTIKSMLIA